MKNLIQKKSNPFLMTLGTLSLLLLFFSCGKGPGSSDEDQPPAKVENAVREAALATVTLSAQAEERLGIAIARAEIRLMPENLSLGGEIVPLPGYEARISAPAAGTVLPPQGGKIPPAGGSVKLGQTVLRLLLMPPEKELMGAREDVAVKQEQFEVAKAKAGRATELLANKAISEKANEDAQVELTRAKAALNAAAARLDLLNGTDVDRAAGSLSVLVLQAPVNGVLKRLFVAPNQTVPAGAALFEVAEIDLVWVRVPVYAGDLENIDVQKGASVTLLGESPKRFSATPAEGPPLSDPSSASSDLYFELPNREGTFRLGQKVGVSLVKKSAENTLAIPWSAILYDFHGGTWVYVKTSAHVYSRSRVELSHVVEGYAVLVRGLAEGDEVVISGAAEIFGTEFGVGK